jgi:acyl-coenzyme A synthetase/AMP-(fatty) acid ligase
VPRGSSQLLCENRTRPRCYPGSRAPPDELRGALGPGGTYDPRTPQGRRERVAVALPDGPDAAVMMISVAAGAVCVPLNRGFTADEWQRYFAELGVAALLTRPDIDSASREVALSLGIPVTAVPAIHRAVLSAADGHKHTAKRSSLRLIRSASSTLPPKVVRELEALFIKDDLNKLK